jgi:Na+/proline symporter
MAVDPLIVVGMAILICVIFVINVYILVYYSHPEDKNESYLAKALVVLGLQLSAMSVLMLPIGDYHFLISPSHSYVYVLFNITLL